MPSELAKDRTTHQSNIKYALKAYQSMLDREEAEQGKVAELRRRKESEEIKQREQSSGTKETPSATLSGVSLVVRPPSMNPDISVN